VQLEEGEEREVGGVVSGFLAAAEDLLLLGEHAEYCEDVAFDLDLFAESGSWGRALPQRRGRSTQHGARQIFILGESVPDPVRCS